MSDIRLVVFGARHPPQFTQWCPRGRSITIAAGVLAGLKMHVAVLQQAGQVAEVPN